MTEKQAERQGLTFTGIYSFDRAKVKEEASRIRALGVRSVMVYHPGNRREGWSVYADESYDSERAAGVDLKPREQSGARSATKQLSEHDQMPEQSKSTP